MQVIVAPDRSEIGKFVGITTAFPGIWRGRVLDVGCRSGGLARVLSKRDVEYCGLDMNPPASLVANFEDPLPFRDSSFDVVVALDVLEHIERIHGAFQELCRVARTYVVISLPNLYEIRTRFRILFGFDMSAKFGLPSDPPRDRHRWFFSLVEARAFCAKSAARCDAEVIGEGCLVGRRRMRLGGRHAIAAFPNLLAPTYVTLIAKRADHRIGVRL